MVLKIFKSPDPLLQATVVEAMLYRLPPKDHPKNNYAYAGSVITKRGVMYAFPSNTVTMLAIDLTEENGENITNRTNIKHLDVPEPNNNNVKRVWQQGALTRNGIIVAGTLTLTLLFFYSLLMQFILLFPFQLLIEVDTCSLSTQTTPVRRFG